jgi:hypothetical protein
VPSSFGQLPSFLLTGTRDLSSLVSLCAPVRPLNS